MGKKLENTEKHLNKAGDVVKVVTGVLSVAGLILKVLSGNNKN